MVIFGGGTGALRFPAPVISNTPAPGFYSIHDTLSTTGSKWSSKQCTPRVPVPPKRRKGKEVRNNYQASSTATARKVILDLTGKRVLSEPLRTETLGYESPGPGAYYSQQDGSFGNVESWKEVGVHQCSKQRRSTAGSARPGTASRRQQAAVGESGRAGWVFGIETQTGLQHVYEPNNVGPKMTMSQLEVSLQATRPRTAANTMLDIRERRFEEFRHWPERDREGPPPRDSKRFPGPGQYANVRPVSRDSGRCPVSPIATTFASVPVQSSLPVKGLDSPGPRYNHPSTLLHGETFNRKDFRPPSSPSRRKGRIKSSLSPAELAIRSKSRTEFLQKAGALVEKLEHDDEIEHPRVVIAQAKQIGDSQVDDHASTSIAKELETQNSISKKNAVANPALNSAEDNVRPALSNSPLGPNVSCQNIVEVVVGASPLLEDIYSGTMTESNDKEQVTKSCRRSCIDWINTIAEGVKL